MKRTIVPAIAGFGLAGIAAGALAIGLFVAGDLGRSRAQAEGIAAARAASEGRAETVAALNRRVVILEGGSPDPRED